MNCYHKATLLRTIVKRKVSLRGSNILDYLSHYQF